MHWGSLSYTEIILPCTGSLCHALGSLSYTESLLPCTGGLCIELGVFALVIFPLFSFSSPLLFFPLILRPLSCAGGLCLALTKSASQQLFATLIYKQSRHIHVLLTHHENMSVIVEIDFAYNTLCAAFHNLLSKQLTVTDLHLPMGNWDLEILQRSVFPLSGVFPPNNL